MKLSQLRGLLEKVAAKETPAEKTKVHKVMREFKHNELRTGKGGKKGAHGKKVTDRPQAIAIAMHEAGLSKNQCDAMLLALGMVKLAKRKKPDLALAEVARRRGEKSWHGFSFVHKKDVPKKEYAAAAKGIGKKGSALQIGFLAKCAELGAGEDELVKIALNWEAIIQAIENFGLGAGAAGKNVFRAGKGLATGIAPELAKAPAGAAGRAGNIAGQVGMGAGAVGLPFMAGRATAPEPESGLQELLERLKG